MYRDLIGTLTYMYSVICRGKGRLPDSDLRHIAEGAHSLTAAAPLRTVGSSFSASYR